MLKIANSVINYTSISIACLLFACVSDEIILQLYICRCHEIQLSYDLSDAIMSYYTILTKASFFLGMFLWIKISQLYSSFNALVIGQVTTAFSAALLLINSQYTLITSSVLLGIASSSGELCTLIILQEQKAILGMYYFFAYLGMASTIVEILTPLFNIYLSWQLFLVVILSCITFNLIYLHMNSQQFMTDALTNNLSIKIKNISNKISNTWDCIALIGLSEAAMFIINCLIPKIALTIWSKYTYAPSLCLFILPIMNAISFWFYSSIRSSPYGLYAESPLNLTVVLLIGSVCSLAMIHVTTFGSIIYLIIMHIFWYIMSIIAPYYFFALMSQNRSNALEDTLIFISIENIFSLIFSIACSLYTNVIDFINPFIYFLYIISSMLFLSTYSRIK